MRASLDIRPLARRSWTGIERYVYHLADALPRALEPTERFTRYAFSFGQWRALRELAVSRLEGHPRAETRILPLPTELFFKWSGQTGIPGLEFLIGRPNVVHVCDGPTLPPRRAALVATIFDLTPRLFPDHFSPTVRAKFEAYFGLVRSRAHRVIAHSHSAMSDIEEHLGIPRGQITVTPLAPDSRFRPITRADAIRRVRRHYGVGDRYVISVGTLGPRKNLETLIRAHALLPAGLRSATELVLCGRDTRHSENLQRLACTLGVAASVRFIGYLPFSDLHHLLCGATASATPSLYEGFGLPVLEAMACGVPVVASDAGSLPEVTGNAGLLVRPEDPDALAVTLEQIFMEPELGVELRQRGFQRAASFTWDRTAEATLGAYRSTLSASSAE